MYVKIDARFGIGVKQRKSENYIRVEKEIKTQK